MSPGGVRVRGVGRPCTVCVLLLAVGLLVVRLLISAESWNVAYLRPREALWSPCATPQPTLFPQGELETQVQRLTDALKAKRRLLQGYQRRSQAPRRPLLPPVDALPSVQCSRVPPGDEGLLRDLVSRGVLVPAGPSQGSHREAFQLKGVDYVPVAEPLRAAVGSKEVDYPHTHSVCNASTAVNTNPAAFPQVSFCAVVRGEGRVKLLVEWVQWHRLLGATFFHLFVEGDSTNSPLLTALRMFIDRGIVRLERLPQPPFSFLGTPTADLDAAFAGVCFEQARARAASAATAVWVALMDIDEFLHTPRCLGAIILDAEAQVRVSKPNPLGRQLGALAVGWTLVGHRGVDIDRDRTVFEATEFAAGTPDPWFRVISRCDAVAGPPLRPKGVPSISLRPTLSERILFQLAPRYGTFFEDGRPAVHDDGTLRSAADHYRPGGAVVAHYHTRSLASTLQRALDRSRFPAAHRTLNDLVHSEFATEQRQGFERRVSSALGALHIHLLQALGHPPQTTISTPSPPVRWSPGGAAVGVQWKRALAASLTFAVQGLPFSNGTLAEALRSASLTDAPDAVAQLREAVAAAVRHYFDPREPAVDILVAL